jgi:hypothetical protein
VKDGALTFTVTRLATDPDGGSVYDGTPFLSFSALLALLTPFLFPSLLLSAPFLPALFFPHSHSRNPHLVQPHRHGRVSLGCSQRSNRQDRCSENDLGRTSPLRRYHCRRMLQSGTRGHQGVEGGMREGGLDSGVDGLGCNRVRAQGLSQRGLPCQHHMYRYSKPHIPFA